MEVVGYHALSMGSEPALAKEEKEAMATQKFIPGVMGLYGWKPGEPMDADQPMYENARTLVYTYRTEPDAIAAVLPEPLEPGPTPTVIVCLNDVPLWRALDGGHHEYTEAIVMVECAFRDEVGLTLGFIYVGGRGGDVTNGADIALALGREVLGNAKKMANINIHPNADEWVGTVDRMGTRLLSFSGRFDEQEIDVADTPMGSLGRLFCVREIPSALMDGYDVRQVLAYEPMFITRPTKLWRGTGSVELGHLDGDPIDLLPVAEPGPAFNSVWSLSEVGSLEIFDVRPELTK